MKKFSVTVASPFPFKASSTNVSSVKTMIYVNNAKNQNTSFIPY